MSDPIDDFHTKKMGGDARTKAMLDAMVQSERDRLTRQQIGQTEVKETPMSSAGTVFPTGIPTGFRFWRTDLGFECYYDGSQWLTVQEYICDMSFETDTALNYAVTTTFVRLGLIHSDYKVYLTRGEMLIFISGTNNGTNYMIYTIKDSSATTVWTFDTSADGTGVNLSKTTNSFTQPGAARTYLELDMARFGVPTAQTPRFPVIFYRLVVT